MSEISINQTSLGSGLMELLGAETIEPGSQAGYGLCKLIWEYHPLGGKLVEKPIRLALSKPRTLTIDAQPKEMLIEAFQKEWVRLGATNHIRDVMFLNRTYGAAAIVMGTPDVPTTEPVDPWKLPDLNIYFNQLDPLNLAGSIVTNQNPNAPDFQKPLAYATAAGQPYHPSRSVVVFNGTPIYLSFQSSGFGYTGRSVFQRALYPLKSFVQSMVTDDLVTFKSGLLIAKQKPAGSIVNKLMQTAAGIKRDYLKQGATGNVLSIDVDEDIEAINMQNTDTAMTTARNNIIANIAAASDVPALLLKDEAFTQGFGEGTEDAKAIVQYVNGIRDDMASLFEFFDKIVMHRAWNKELFEAIQNHEEYGEYYKGMSYEQAFYHWKDNFKAEWESLIEEPESEKVKVDDTKLKGITEILRTLMPVVDPQNRALTMQWAQDNINEMQHMFASSLQLDFDALSEFEPPEGTFHEQKEPSARSDAAAPIRGEERANPAPKFPYIAISNDAEHWVTLHGGEGEEGHGGSHVLINGAGEIVAGAGGKLNGQTLGNVKSKSKDVEKHGAPAPQHPPKPPENTEKIEPQVPAKPKSIKEQWEETKVLMKQESESATSFSESAKTKEEHMEGMARHSKLYEYYKKSFNTEMTNHHAKLFNKHLAEVKKAEKQEKEPKGASEKAKESMFSKQSASEVSSHFKEKYNLGFANGSTAEKDAKKVWEEYRTARRNGESSEVTDKLFDKYNELTKQARESHAHRIKGHTQYDIESSTAGSKAVRKILGHVDSALSGLESQGFDIKAALARGNVQYASGTTGKSNGHAWQQGGIGYFAISTTKRLGNDPEQARMAEMRKMEGKPKWSISSTSKYQARATIVHELAHALGMQKELDSPKRLTDILVKEFNSDYAKIKDFVKNNISEYATANIRETDAELAAMVTDPDYVRGTLPKSLEDHVDWLFMRKQ